ncbi:MAG TPA: PKD domain-containing protein [Bacteroidales bacterium]|nr:PKD domain-containing protein [Bacteroidales bacterium]
MKKLIKYFVVLMSAFPCALMAQYDFSADVTEGCDSLTVHFSFTSTAAIDTIIYIIWDLGNGKVDTTLDESDIVTTKYTIPSRYPVVVYLNDFYVGEVLVKSDYIKVYHSVTTGFTAGDTSQIAPYTWSFKDASLYFDNSTTFTYYWSFGDGNTATGMNTIHTYASPGTYNVSLAIIDGYGCANTASKSINIPAIIPPPDITASETEGCDSLNVKFSLVDVDTDTITLISWDFGNGETSDDLDPDTVLYRADGQQPVNSYTVRVIINGDTGNAVEKSDFITVHRTVRADFECRDSLVTSNSIIKVCYSLDPLFDTSAVYQFEWDVEGFGSSSDIRPVYTLENSFDTIPAALTITDMTYGCSDSNNQLIFVIPEVPIQNVFTPNGDGKNEYFIINTGGIVHLQIKIYSRSGLLIYEGEGTEIVWDGKSLSGAELESGIYYYVLSSLRGDPDGKYNKAGFVYLLK